MYHDIYLNNFFFKFFNFVYFLVFNLIFCFSLSLNLNNKNLKKLDNFKVILVFFLIFVFYSIIFNYLILFNWFEYISITFYFILITQIIFLYKKKKFLNSLIKRVELKLLGKDFLISFICILFFLFQYYQCQMLTV